MTIIVSILAPSGIILTADSRQLTESASGQLRVDSDNAEKIIQLGPRLAAMVSGRGTFYSDRGKSPQSIGDILRISAVKLHQNSTVNYAAVFFHKRMTAVMKKNMEVADSRQAFASYYLTGCGPDKTIGELYRCEIPGGINLERKTDDAGAVWNGEHAIVNRLILGYDPRMFDSLSSVDGGREIRDKLQQTCREMHLHINFQTMPLQDAVDLAVLLLRTTIDLLRFSVGLVGVPGQFPT